MAAPRQLTTRILAKADYPAVARVVNEAFLADAFFKKPEFKNRLDDVGSQLDNMIAEKNHCVIVAEDDVGVVGAVHVYWHSDSQPHGGFGMLSVSKAREKGGIGKSLVRAAEEKIHTELLPAKIAGEALYIEIPVINFRPELIPWYERQGYKQTGEIRPFEAPHIIADGYDIQFVMMRKSI